MVNFTDHGSIAAAGKNGAAKWASNSWVPAVLVDAVGTATYSFNSAEIVSMESDNPMGSFTVKERILKNPGRTFGLYGNNHHCVIGRLFYSDGSILCKQWIALNVRKVRKTI